MEQSIRTTSERTRPTERADSWYARFDTMKLAIGVLLVVAGILILINPDLLAVTVALGALVLGALVIADASVHRP